METRLFEPQHWTQPNPDERVESTTLKLVSGDMFFTVEHVLPTPEEISNNLSVSIPEDSTTAETFNNSESDTGSIDTTAASIAYHGLAYAILRHRQERTKDKLRRVDDSKVKHETGLSQRKAKTDLYHQGFKTDGSDGALTKKETRKERKKIKNDTSIDAMSRKVLLAELDAKRPIKQNRGQKAVTKGSWKSKLNQLAINRKEKKIRKLDKKASRLGDRAQEQLDRAIDLKT